MLRANWSRRAVPALIALVVALASGGTPVMAEEPPLPGEAELRQRVEAQRAAFARDDWQALFDLRTPDYRSCHTPDRLRADFAMKVVSCTVKAMRLADPGETATARPRCSAAPLAFECGAVVTLRLKARAPSGETGSGKLICGWLRIDGTWYWYDESPPERPHRCPD